MSVAQKVESYINRSFVGASAQPVGTDDSLLDSGILDSVGIAELITFVETEFGVRIEDEEVVPDNFETVARVTALVDRKRG